MYKKNGFVQQSVGAIIFLVIGVGVAVLVLIFVGTLGGQTYQLTESKIDAITNTTIKNSVKSSIVNGFDALNQTSSYLPIIVLAVVIALVLALVVGMSGGMGMSRGGGAL